MDFRDIGNAAWRFGTGAGLISELIGLISGNNSAEDSYYDTPIDEVNDWLGIGSAGREAEWNRQESLANFEREKELINMQNNWSAQQLQEQREWQADREDSYYSRAVNGLLEAGLNPILAVGMSMPQSTSPTAQSTQGVASFLGANGVASGSGLSGLSMLANSALNVYRTGYVLNAIDRYTYRNNVRGVGRAISNVLKRIK